MTMQKYLGVKLIDAEPLNLGAYNKLRGWEMPADEDPMADGYLVVYPDGYRSWSPKAQFEAAYFALQDADGATIRQDDVDRFMGQSVVRQLDPKTALVSVETVTGFVQHESSSCVDPANFDEEIGREIGEKKIKDGIWKCLGFVLQWAKNGVKGPERQGMPDYQQRVVCEKQALDRKLQALDGFIAGDVFRHLPADEQERLRLQSSWMGEYSIILGERIEAFV